MVGHKPSSGGQRHVRDDGAQTTPAPASGHRRRCPGVGERSPLSDVLRGHPVLADLRGVPHSLRGRVGLQVTQHPRQLPGSDLHRPLRGLQHSDVDRMGIVAFFCKAIYLCPVRLLRVRSSAVTIVRLAGGSCLSSTIRFINWQNDVS